MKKLSVIIASLIFVLGVSKAVVAQVDNKSANHNATINVPSFAILDIEGGENVVLSVDISELEAGNRVDFEGISNNDAWLNYTVIISKNKTRTINASLTNENLPAGVSLVLDVAADKDGVGSVGTVEDDSFILGSTLQPIISTIGSSYTNNGINHGHNLTYRLNMDDDDLGTLVSGTSYSATVVYTFTDVN